MTEYVAQKYFRKIQNKPLYETVSPRRSEFRSIESEHQRVSFDVPAEQAAGEDDAVFLEIPRTDIESLISQLIQTGSFLILLLLDLKFNYVLLVDRVPEAIGLDSVVLIDSVFSSFGGLLRPGIPASNCLLQS